MTEQEIMWAGSHDWFVADNGDGTIEVVERWVDRDDVYHEELVTWVEGFRALRDWAGY